MSEATQAIIADLQLLIREREREISKLRDAVAALEGSACARKTPRLSAPLRIVKGPIRTITGTTTGVSHRQIAEFFGVSKWTVKHHAGEKGLEGAIAYLEAKHGKVMPRGGATPEPRTVNAGDTVVIRKGKASRAADELQPGDLVARAVTPPKETVIAADPPTPVEAPSTSATETTTKAAVDAAPPSAPAAPPPLPPPPPPPSPEPATGPAAGRPAAPRPRPRPPVRTALEPVVPPLPKPAKPVVANLKQRAVLSAMFRRRRERLSMADLALVAGHNGLADAVAALREAGFIRSDTFQGNLRNELTPAGIEAAEKIDREDAA